MLTSFSGATLCSSCQDFLCLQLCEEIGAHRLAGLEPPPKRTLAGVNRRADLIEHRRWELEQWLWRLTEIPSVAHSVMLAHFCELDAASYQLR
jgi:hypothetical protein